MSIPTVEVQKLAEDDVLLDVREPEEWQAGHAPGALHVPMSEFPARYAEVEAATRDGRVNVICRSGVRSGRVAAYLLTHGMDATNVAGGMESWAAAGRPVVTDSGGPGEVV